MNPTQPVDTAAAGRKACGHPNEAPARATEHSHVGADAAPYVLDVRGLCFSYHHLELFRDLDFSLRRGEFCALVGANGAGKSSFVKLILGELKPQAGRVELFGTDVARFTDFPKIGYMPQSLSIDFDRFPVSVTELVSSALYRGRPRFRGLSREDKRRVDAALERLGLTDLRHRLLSELSGGQRQRVFLARTLVDDPEFIVLDEPTTALDAASSHAFVHEIESAWRDTGATVLMITHDLCCLPERGVRVVELSHGRMHPFHELAAEIDAIDCTCDDCDAPTTTGREA